MRGHPQVIALMALSDRTTHFACLVRILSLRRVRLPTVSLCCRGRWLQMINKPPREVTFPIRPQYQRGTVRRCYPWLSGMDRTGQICRQNDNGRMLLVRLCGPIRVLHGL